jgi:hypothetical protein
LPIAFRIIFIKVSLMALTGAVAAAPDQLPPPPLPVDPTPLTQLLSSSERALIESTRDPKKRVEEFLKVAESHLKAASTATDAADHVTAERELDIYNKATAAAVSEAFSLKNDRRKIAKKIEQRLLKHLRILEKIDQLFPPERAPFARDALIRAKRLRVRALNEAFGTGDVLKTVPDSPGSGMTRDKKRPLAIALVAAGFAYSRFTPPKPQIPGDYLNKEEDEHVRQAQQIDERIKVFMKIADRRLAAVKPPPPPPSNDKKALKKSEEELKEWGPAPQVSRAELLRHYVRAIQEAIAKLEDAHERNPKHSALRKALGILSEATDRQLQLLQSLSAEMTGDGEGAALEKAIAEAKFANSGAREGLK